MVYRFTLRPTGPMGTPFRSDTLFGHACWAIRYCDGEEELESFLDAARRQRPEVVFSDGFPSGCLPCPRVPRDGDAGDDPASAARYKRVKTMRWVNAVRAEAAGWIIDERFADEALVPAQPPAHVAMRNRIDRLTGTTPDEHGLYATEYEWYDGAWEKVDIYVDTEWGMDKLARLLDKMFEQGYGRDQTTGAGAVSLEDGPTAAALPAREESRTCMCLSRTVPCEGVCLEESYYTAEAKFGKVWQGLGHANPFKKGLLQLAPGSVLKVRERRERYGRVVGNVHQSDAIIENCMTIPYFLPEEACNG